MQAALSVKGWERLPRDELVLKACQAVAAVAREKSRCAELVYRLQQTHEDSIEARQLQTRFAELQASSLLCIVLAEPSICKSKSRSTHSSPCRHTAQGASRAASSMMSSSTS